MARKNRNSGYRGRNFTILNRKKKSRDKYFEKFMTAHNEAVKAAQENDATGGDRNAAADTGGI